MANSRTNLELQKAAIKMLEQQFKQNKDLIAIQRLTDQMPECLKGANLSIYEKHYLADSKKMFQDMDETIQKLKRFSETDLSLPGKSFSMEAEIKRLFFAFIDYGTNLTLKMSPELFNDLTGVDEATIYAYKTLLTDNEKKQELISSLQDINRTVQMMSTSELKSAIDAAYIAACTELPVIQQAQIRKINEKVKAFVDSQKKVRSAYHDSSQSASTKQTQSGKMQPKPDIDSDLGSKPKKR